MTATGWKEIVLPRFDVAADLRADRLTPDAFGARTGERSNAYRCRSAMQSQRCAESARSDTLASTGKYSRRDLFPARGSATPLNIALLGRLRSLFCCKPSIAHYTVNCRSTSKRGSIRGAGSNIIQEMTLQADWSPELRLSAGPDGAMTAKLNVGWRRRAN